MGQDLAITGWPGLLVVSLPLLVLLFVVIWAVRKTRTIGPELAGPEATPVLAIHPQPELSQTERAYVAHTPVATSSQAQEPDMPAQSAVSRMTESVKPPARSVEVPATSEPASPADSVAHTLIPAARTAGSAAATSVTNKPAAPAAAAELSAAIARAEASDDKVALATLYVQEAQGLIEASDFTRAATRLRDAIGIAALRRLPEPHALARLELGDLYMRQGDPITACEQWQIARKLFYEELSRKDEGAKLDRRMLDNGCPTDWVLTDF